MKDGIYIKGAREHNLKSIDVFIPRNQITVITGVSGSGKSSLAYDTLYSEGQRRYIETLSTYSRYFMDQLKLPDMDSIFGLSPVIAIDQKTISHNPRSTIGTITEIYDYLRLLFAKLGTPICPIHEKPLKKTSIEEILENIFKIKKKSLIQIFSPVIRGQKGGYSQVQKYIEMGFLKARINQKLTVLNDKIKFNKNQSYHVELLIDQLYIEKKYFDRIKQSIQLACKLSNGFIQIESDNKNTLYQMQSSCPICLFSPPEIEPKLFSFNNPKGACPKCNGIGTIDKDGASITCNQCKGSRLRTEALCVQIGNKNISQLSKMDLEELSIFLKKLKFEKRYKLIAKNIIQQILHYLNVFNKVGVSYLSLDRSTTTLSGGEAQRIRLASQISSVLIGVLYIFDEPSIGLHPADHENLLDLIEQIKDRKNTILMVEHDEQTIRKAEYIIDIGPRAGKNGGHLVFQGSLKELLKNQKSLTAKYLSKKNKISVPKSRRKGKYFLELTKASGNNLKNVNLKLPLGTLIGITGVSGSGKSSLIVDTLYKTLSHKLHRGEDSPLTFEKLIGFQNIDKVISVNQKPIGRTSRSIPATYIGVMDLIRNFMSLLPTSQVRGYTPGYFSFNIKGGRCEHCEGAGQIKQEMHFLSDAIVPCEMCQQKRYSLDILSITYKGKNISDILSMTVKEALLFFKDHPLIFPKLKQLEDVGLSYLTLGQSSSTLSGGEAQRIKLTKELSKKHTKRTLYILDEPTTGLHFDDIRRLLQVLNYLVDKGNTVIVIEHNLDVIKSCDHLIDLGPRGGKNGGYIIDQGTPERISKNKKSLISSYLAMSLKK